MRPIFIPFFLLLIVSNGLISQTNSTKHLSFFYEPDDRGYEIEGDTLMLYFDEIDTTIKGLSIGWNSVWESTRKDPQNLFPMKKMLKKMGLEFIVYASESSVDQGSVLNIILENEIVIQLVNDNRNSCARHYFIPKKSHLKLLKKYTLKSISYEKINIGKKLTIKENIHPKNSAYIMGLLEELEKVKNEELRLQSHYEW